MTLYGLYSGGTRRCSGTTRAGKPCRRTGYVVNLQYAYWCTAHLQQDPHRS